MQTVVDLWWLWLVLAVVLMGYALVNQVLRIKRIANGRVFSDPSSFGKGMVSFVLAGFGGGVSMLLFVVSVIWMLVKG